MVRPVGLKRLLAGFLVLLFAGTVMATVLTAPPGEGGDAIGDDVLVQRTPYGIPHITASDWYGLGLGYGYVAAEDYLCLIAEEYVTVAGERSRYFGSQAGYDLSSNGQRYNNPDSDLFFRLLDQHPDLVESIADNPDADLQAAIDGYVAGYNRYLDETPTSELSSDCAGEPWVRPITRADFVHRANKLNLIASMGYFAPYMVRAQPPALAHDAAAMSERRVQPAADDWLQALDERLPTSETLGLGSNGYAFGKELTANGRGMLLGNPHFPWNGPERFHQLHLTIPGEVDVMGMTLLGVPLVLIGFTEHVAWTHTVSTGWRFSLHELQLVPGDPTAYVVDGTIERMSTRDVHVETAEGNTTHTFYFSRYGPIIDFPLAGGGGQEAGLRWTHTTAYALNDANARNDRTALQFLRWNTADSFDDFVEELTDVHGIPWVNTIAASPDGRALYADVSVVPHYDADKIDRCNTPIGRATFAAARLPVFDGSRSACAPTQDDRAAQDGIIPAAEMPLIVTDDWLINSNDDAWLPNPEHPITGYSPMIGPGPSERSGRTRMGYVLAAEHQPGSLDLTALQDSLFSNRLYYPEQELSTLLRATCEPTAHAVASDGALVDLTEACQVLTDWDLSARTDSRGLALFERFWLQAPKTWATPFDEEDPVHTPRDLIVTPEVRAALADAVLDLERAALPLDVRTGDARSTERDGERIGLHGAAHALGSPSMLVVPWRDGVGYQEPIHGNSYIQTVTWNDEGPVAAAILSYSQSPHSDSSHHADQTRLYSDHGWVELPFQAESVAAEATAQVVLSR